MDKDELMDMCFPKDPNKETVREEDHPEKAWFEEAGKMTIEELPKFIDKLVNGYNHDYGTVCHAVSACALAAAWAVNKDENIGLTGFQAGFVMWDFIRQWQKPFNKTGMKLVDYDDMLYPQYAFKYEKTISRETWEKLKEEARRLLNDRDQFSARESVRSHWQNIAAGNIPFGYKIEERP